jgi:hypothetical protein
MSGLSVMEHIALVQRAQAIAATDHAALVRAHAELAEARAELKWLRRRVRRRAPAISGRRGLNRLRGPDDDGLQLSTGIKTIRGAVASAGAAA